MSDQEGYQSGDENSQRQSKVWTKGRQFTKASELDDFLAAETFWKRKKTTRTFDGTKQYYYCNVMSRKTPCPAMIYVSKGKNDYPRVLFESGDHVHDGDEKEPRRKDVPPNIVDRIRESVKNKEAPRTISHQLRKDDNIEEKPTQNQVSIS